jgi:mannan endo-1,4-beta-mannosidase
VKKETLLTMAVCVLSTTTLHAQNYRFEAELGVLNGAFTANSKPGYSGTGYVSFYTDTPQSVQVQASVPDGLYELWVGYNSEFGFKGYDYQVDGVTGSGGFDGTGTNEWSTDRAGTFSLTGATNSLQINRGWGWYNVDYFELRPFTPPSLLPITASLVDAQADRPTQTLWNYLKSEYGHRTLSGLQHNSSDNLSFPVANYLSQSGGIKPAIRGSDLIDYSPTRIAFDENPQNETEQTIAWAKQTGGIASVMWHWNAPANLTNDPCGSNCGPDDYPWWRGFYTQGTSFDLPGALADHDSNDFQLILHDIDAIAVQLQKYEDAGVPVIWRPLHEAQGGWFWWGAHGSENFKQLWHVMYDRLTNHHGLHNLIWEFTSIGVNGDEDDWYPGDDEVDIVGLDIYTQPTDPMNGQWLDALDMYNGRKMIALSETDTIVDPTVLNQWGTHWGYASPWTWDYVRSEYANSGYSMAQLSTILQQFLNSDDVITLNELPILPWNNLAPSLPGDYNDDGTVDAADYTVWRNSFGQTGTSLAADGDGNGTIDEGDYDVWRLYFGETANAGSASGLATPEPSTLLLVLVSVACLTLNRSVRLGLAAR